MYIYIYIYIYIYSYIYIYEYTYNVLILKLAHRIRHTPIYASSYYFFFFSGLYAQSGEYHNDMQDLSNISVYSRLGLPCYEKKKLKKKLSVTD